MSGEDTFFAEVDRSLEMLQRSLGRQLTMKEAEAVADGLIYQAEHGHEVDAGFAYWQAHPDGNPYDLDRQEDRRQYMTQRLRDGEQARAEVAAEEDAADD